MKEITQYLYEHIPLTKAMGLKVVEYGPQVKLSVPLAPNINHKSTAFGGSISTALITAGWVRVRKEVQKAGLRGEIVIQDSSVQFRRPVTGDFVACCLEPQKSEWERMLHTLEKSGKGRISLQCVIGEETSPLASFIGKYVVLKSSS